MLSSGLIRDLWCLDPVGVDLNLIAAVPQRVDQSHTLCGAVLAKVRLHEVGDCPLAYSSISRSHIGCVYGSRGDGRRRPGRPIWTVSRTERPT